MAIGFPFAGKHPRIKISQAIDPLAACWTEPFTILVAVALLKHMTYVDVVDDLAFLQAQPWERTEPNSWSRPERSVSPLRITLDMGI
ncbi:hypothetical protein MRBLMA1_001672 [Sphingobium sp. LMA1-1-1.1]|uniref:hypothetical protein n=1 Tax=unclassified Sphingobium TaxID=2611147 RepID=UPI0034490CEC